jgi:tetratricopeptide (TPR) repeat protein
MNYNNLLVALITISCSCIRINAANEAGEPTPTKENSKAADLNTRFSNLPLEKRQKYLELRAEAHRFFSNKRTFETLMAIHEMRTIFDGDPLALNLHGAIYVEFRDFKKAREIFTNAIEIAGEDPKILFNLAELEFCDSQWSNSIEKFSKLLIQMEGQPVTDFMRLIEFKVHQQIQLPSRFTLLLLLKRRNGILCGR